MVHIENAILLFNQIFVECVRQELPRPLHLPLSFHTKIGQNSDQRARDRQNDRNRDLLNQIKERELRLRLLDDVATVRTRVGVFGYFSATFFALHHRHKKLVEEYHCELRLSLDNLDMTARLELQ